MDFRFIFGNPETLASFHVMSSKQGADSVSG